MIKEYWTKMGFTPIEVSYLIKMEKDFQALNNESFYLGKRWRLNSNIITVEDIRKDIQEWKDTFGIK